MQPGEALGGPNAIGVPGDLVLENDQVVFVIDRLSGAVGFAESGGNIVDAADATTRKDELGQLFTYFGDFPRQGVYDTLTSGTDPDGEAWVEATGVELREPAISVRTRTRLRPTDRGAIIETTLKNTGSAPIELPGLGDAIQWGGAEKVAPGKASGFTGASSGPWVAGVGRFVSYGVAPTQGTIDATSGSSWTDTLVRGKVRLGPGASVSFQRLFVVGERADTSSVVSSIALTSGQPLADIAITLVAAPGKPSLAPTDDARVSVRDATGAERLTMHAHGNPPQIKGALPSQRWTLAYAGGGGRAGVGAIDVDAKIGTTTSAALSVAEGGSAGVECVAVGGAPMPCKVTFERTDRGPAPDFGPASAAGPARSQVTTADGKVSVPLAVGAYRVTASRGPEYTLAQADLSISPGQRASLVLSPRRVVVTDGYLACDFHQHTMLGTDAPVSTRDRVISNVAEGVEVAVASEHNWVADLEPIVRELGLERTLISISGDELTSDASEHAWGHANAWPLRHDSTKARGGAPDVRTRTLAELVDDLRRSSPEDFVLQINHPRSGHTGYFDLTGFDRRTGLGTVPGYEARFDALEVWNGRNVTARDRILLDFLALLSAGRPVTPTADTDTHSIVGQEAGYPRTYVRVADDGPLDPWGPERTRDLVRGVKDRRDVVLTNGPMLRVTANGVPVGGVARGRRLHVKVHVESAPWVVVNEVRVMRASAPAQPDVKTIRESLLPSGALAADVTFELGATSDDAFVVIATGDVTLAPVLASATAAEISPWAMTGALWIDADGDGRVLGMMAPPAAAPP
jgi:hypothetical protein